MLLSHLGHFINSQRHGPHMGRVALCGAQFSSLEIAEGARTTLWESKNPDWSWEIVI